MQRTLKEKLVRKLVLFKYMLQRGYMWVQLPVLASMGAGILHPYITPHYDIHLWQLAFIALAIFIFVGYLDKKLKLLHTETAYQTEVNPLLLEKFEEIKEKVDKLNRLMEGGNNGSEYTRLNRQT